MGRTHASYKITEKEVIVQGDGIEGLLWWGWHRVAEVEGRWVWPYCGLLFAVSCEGLAGAS